MSVLADRPHPACECADNRGVPRLLSNLLAPRISRVWLLAYILLLATATHWPRLRIVGPVPRSDLWMHLGAFGTLGCLATLAGFFGAAGSRRNLVLSWCLAVGYAALDEATQAIPALGRTAALDDFAADATGVSLGVAAAAALARLVWGVSGPAGSPSASSSAIQTPSDQAIVPPHTPG